DQQWRARETEYVALKLRIEKLSTRDRETLDLIWAGESNKTMAAKLFISQRAVEMRRAAIMRKLNVRSLAELLALTITSQNLSDRPLAGRDQAFRATIGPRAMGPI